MKNVYDIVIIGSGLNALATLYGILQSKKKYKIALITGKPSFSVKYNHPKLFNDLINFKKILSHKSTLNDLFLPGNIGGLVFFWGEQCNVNEQNYLKKNYFKSKSFFSKFLELKKGKRLFERKIDNLNIFFNSPDRTIKNKQSILKFKKYFQKKCVLYHREALSIDGNFIHLDNKDKIFGKKIFLCAGLIGTINLLRSINNKIDFSFKDHSPKIDLVYSSKYNQNYKLDSIYSMICKVYSKRNKIKFYNKFYPVRSLEILFFLGKFKFLLPKFILRLKINIKNFYFVQKWGNNSISEYTLKDFSIKKKTNIEDFKKLDKVYNKLNLFKLFSFKPNFLNFHFHCLKIIINKKKISVNKFLKMNNSNIYCPGMLSQNKINCLPPSFDNFIKTSTFLKKKLNSL